MTIREKHQALAAKYHWLITPLGTLLLGYLGFDGYQKYEAAQAAAPTEVSVTVSAPISGNKHAHGAVVSQNDIETLIQRHVNVAINQMNAAIKKQHEKDLVLFKKKESWDTD